MLIYLRTIIYQSYYIVPETMLLS